MPRRRKTGAAGTQSPPATPEPNQAAYARLVAEADRVGWPITDRDSLDCDDYHRLHGKDGVPVPRRFGWNLQETGTQLFAADDLLAFLVLTLHVGMFGITGKGNYYIDDGSTLRQCTMAEMLTWLAQQVDLRRYAEGVAVAAEELRRVTPPADSQDRVRWQIFRAAAQQWRVAKDQFDYALDIVEHYGNHR